MHFSARQPQRKDLLIRFGQRLQKPFRVDLRGDFVFKLRMFIGTEQSVLRAVYELVDAQHVDRLRRRMPRPRVRDDALADASRNKHLRRIQRSADGRRTVSGRHEKPTGTLKNAPDLGAFLL